MNYGCPRNVSLTPTDVINGFGFIFDWLRKDVARAEILLQ